MSPPSRLKDETKLEHGKHIVLRVVCSCIFWTRIQCPKSLNCHTLLVGGRLHWEQQDQSWKRVKKKQLSGDRWPNWRWISGTIGLAGGESHRWHNWTWIRLRWRWISVILVQLEVDQCNLEVYFMVHRCYWATTDWLLVIRWSLLVNPCANWRWISGVSGIGGHW